MRAPKMHADEVDVDVAVVRRLVAEQLPRWAELPLEPVLPWGTDNALYRLGSELVIRLPRTPRTVGTLEKERTWLPRLAPHLPVAVPVPVAEGAPGAGYPFTWSVYTWIEGENATPERVGDQHVLARDLARFIAALQRIDTAGTPSPGTHNFGRGEPLANRDAPARAALAQLEIAGAAEVWDDALAAPVWSEAPVWLHGDLDSRNVLVREGRLSGVLDWGAAGVGDPAADVMVAWKLFDADARETFRAALAVDDATWTRARGWALSQAVIALAYYTEETNAVLVGEARRWLAEVLPS